MNYKRLLVLLLFSTSIVSHSQTADEIVNRYIQFTGGAENWKAVKTIITSGTYNYGGVEFPYTAYSKAPNLYKYDVPFNGKSFTQAYNGDIGWRIDGFKNETAKTILKGKQAANMANEADVELESGFINYKEKGNKISIIGTDTINKQLCYKIKLERPNDTAVYYFDNKDYSLVKKQTISRNSEMDNAPLDILYSDYQVTDKIKLPHKINYWSVGTRVLAVTVKSVKLNEPIEDSVFQP